MSKDRQERQFSVRKRLALFVGLAVVVAAADLWTKEIAFARLSLGGHTDWLLDSWVRFRFCTNLNQGALWGMGQGFSYVFAGFSLLAVAGILYWLFIRKACGSLWLLWALAMISGGAVGNFYDRMAWHGIRLAADAAPIPAVRDFLHFQFGSFDWAIFNIADVALVTGSIMLMLQSLTAPEGEEALVAEANAAGENASAEVNQEPESRTALA